MSKKNIPIPEDYVGRLVKSFCASPELAAQLTKMVDREISSVIHKAGIEFTREGEIVVFDWAEDVIFAAPVEKLVREQLKKSPKPATHWRETAQRLRKLADYIDKTIEK